MHKSILKYGLSTALLLLFLVGSTQSNAQGGGKVVDKIIAKVNNYIILDRKSVV